MVEDSASSTDEDVDSMSKGLGLGVDVYTSIHGQGGKLLLIVLQVLQYVLDLIKLSVISNLRKILWILLCSTVGT